MKLFLLYINHLFPWSQNIKQSIHIRHLPSELIPHPQGCDWHRSHGESIYYCYWYEYYYHDWTLTLRADPSPTRVWLTSQSWITAGGRMWPLLTIVSSTSKTVMGEPGLVISKLTSKKSRKLGMSCRNHSGRFQAQMLWWKTQACSFTSWPWSSPSGCKCPDKHHLRSVSSSNAVMETQAWSSPDWSQSSPSGWKCPAATVVNHSGAKVWREMTRSRSSSTIFEFKIDRWCFLQDISNLRDLFEV